MNQGVGINGTDVSKSILRATIPSVDEGDTKESGVQPALVESKLIPAEAICWLAILINSRRRDWSEQLRVQTAVAELQ